MHGGTINLLNLVRSQELTDEENMAAAASSTFVHKPSSTIDVGKLTKAARQKSATHTRVTRHLRKRSTLLKTAVTNVEDIQMHRRLSSIPPMERSSPPPIDTADSNF